MSIRCACNRRRLIISATDAFERLIAFRGQTAAQPEELAHRDRWLTPKLNAPTANGELLAAAHELANIGR